MTRARRVRDGVIVSEVVDVTLGDRASMEQAAFFQSAAQRIAAHRAAAQKAIDQGATGRRLDCAKTAARLLDDAVGMLERKDAEGAVWNVITAMECLWVIDVKQVEPEIITGARSRRGGRKGNTEKTTAAKQVQAGLQAQADEVWKRRPAWSASEVARHIDAARAEYIRKRIRKPEK